MTVFSCLRVSAASKLNLGLEVKEYHVVYQRKNPAAEHMEQTFSHIVSNKRPRGEKGFAHVNLEIEKNV